MFPIRGLLTAAVLFLCTLPAYAQFLPVTGVHTGINSVSGARPSRLNIEILAVSGEPWYCSSVPVESIVD